jgi:polysaccharide export outer membrane protein
MAPALLSCRAEVLAMRYAVTLLLAGMIAAGCATDPVLPTASPAAAPATPGAPAPAAGPGASRMPAPPTMAPPPAVSLAPATTVDGDYKLAAKDQVTVTVYGQDDMTRTLRVSQSGTITLPLLGEVKAAGLSPTELEQKIEGGLRGKYLVNPRVTVSVAEFQGRQFAVMGAVNQPGAYPLKTNATTVMLALSEAKGVKDTADRIAYVLRARPRTDEPQPLAVDLEALLRQGAPAQNVVVEAGDSVYVPEANTFYVAGEVEKRGAFVLRRDTTLSRALTEAGGVTKRASTDEVKVVRTQPDGGKQELGPFDIRQIMAGDKSQDVALQAHDVVVVPQSGAKSAAYGVLDFLKGLFSIGLTP